MSNEDPEVQVQPELPLPDPGNSDPVNFTEELTDEEVLEANQAVESTIAHYGIVDGGAEQ